MTAIQAGIKAYKSAEIVPTEGVNYGDYEARLARYRLARAYYNNTVYDMLGDNTPNEFVKSRRLYRFMRGIYNPVERQNNLIVAYTYRGAVDLQNLRGGALPLQCDDRLLEPLTQLIKWSNLGQQLSDYVRRNARDGDVFWWLVDDPFRRRVRLELLDAEKVRDVERDEVGNIRAAVIEYRRFEEPDTGRYVPGKGRVSVQDGKAYTYTMVVTRDEFVTYRDGEEYGYQLDANGEPMSRWPNDYGFVPLKHAYYDEGQDGWGKNSFLGTPRVKIDELNDQASIINDSIRRVIQPILKVKNVNFVGRDGRATTELTTDVDSRTDMIMLRLSKPDADIEALTIPLDIGQAAKNRDDLLAELMRDMPELSLQSIRDNAGNLSGRAIENLYGDATSSIENTRKNVDPPLAAALQMGLTIGGIRRYDGFTGITADSYDRGELELDIRARPVIEDKLDVMQRMTFLGQVKDQPPAIARVMLKDMLLDNDTIEDIVSELQSTQAQARQQPNTLAAGDNSPFDLETLLSEAFGNGNDEPAADAV
jgi:hypothetical protein